MPGHKTLAIALVIALLLATVPASAASSEPGVRITRLIIEPDGPDFNLTAHYSTSFIMKIFSILFGARVVQPGIVDQLSGFGDVELVGIDTLGQTAKLQAKNQARLIGSYYLYDRGAEFPVAIDRLEIRGTAFDLPRTINNTTSVPMFYYNVKA